MNFPDSQRTGALGELDVARVFTDWKWSVGRYLIDSGYDLYVTPDQEKYRGISFYVQVKGTAKESGKKVTAPVSRSRLRTYANSILPVFIVRATADGQLFWADAQAWAGSCSGGLKGGGYVSVGFAQQNNLTDRAEFESYLARLLPEVAQKLSAVSELSIRSRYLNSIDPHFGVRISKTAGSTEHMVFARERAAAAAFSFKPKPAQENVQNLRDAIEFGLPRTVEVEGFRITGSPLFDAIGANAATGTLTFSRAEKSRGSVRLYPGRAHLVTSQEVVIEADLFNGVKGYAVSNEGYESVFALTLRADMGARTMAMNISLRPEIAHTPIREIDALRPLADWCDQVAIQKGMLVELCFRNVRAPATVGAETVQELWPFLQWARTLSRLHLLAKALGSTISLPEDLGFSSDDVETIDLAFSLMKGERIQINLGPQEIEPELPLNEVSPDSLYTTTTMALSIFGAPLGEIPVGIEYSGFTMENVPGSKTVRLLQGDGGKAWISRAEQNEVGEWLGREARVERT